VCLLAGPIQNLRRANKSFEMWQVAYISERLKRKIACVKKFRADSIREFLLQLRPEYFQFSVSESKD